jgi:DNA replication protein DnaC
LASIREGGRALTELKALRLCGMAGAWTSITAQGECARVDAARWLIEHLVDEEQTDRAMRSISYQMHAARFPVHRDLAGFDFAQSKVDRGLIIELADLAFTEAAHNVVFIGGTGTGKTAMGVSGITRHSKRVRFCSTVGLVYRNSASRGRSETDRRRGPARSHRCRTARPHRHWYVNRAASH